MRTFLVQSGVLGHEELLRLTAQRHAAYCTLHGIFFASYSERTRQDREGNWDGVDRIVEVLEKVDTGDLVVHLDADSIIKDRTIHLSAALSPPHLMGMVPSSHIQWLKSVRPNMDFQHWDKLPQFISGGSWTIKSSSTLALWKEVQARGPIENPMGWKVQATLMACLLNYQNSKFLVQSLEPKWFCQPYHPVTKPIILHPLQGGDLQFKLRVLKKLVEELS